MENQVQKTGIKNLRIEMQNFQSILNSQPPQEHIKDVPFGGGAKYLPISFVEMKLDELFFGQWQSENFKWSGILNEIQGSLDLVVFHPVTMQWIRRVGAASIVIMVDALSEESKKNMTSQERNTFATSPENKKPNALDLAFPKLKAECLKNAALSLGSIFGRDINRKFKAIYTPLQKSIKEVDFEVEQKRCREFIEKSTSREQLLQAEKSVDELLLRDFYEAKLDSLHKF